MANNSTGYSIVSEEIYIKSMAGYRSLALSIPALCVSLSSALLAFEIYYLQHFYVPKPGFFVEDAIVILPMFVGSLFLIAAAFAVDWVLDSMSPVETQALSSMYPEDTVPHYEFAKGFYFRATLFSGAYAIFCICLALLLFLLIAAIPIFLHDTAVDTVAREIILFAGAYYAMLILLKMLTTTLPGRVWLTLSAGFLLFLTGNVWSLLRLIRVM
jgi:hypothetical protein